MTTPPSAAAGALVLAARTSADACRFQKVLFNGGGVLINRLPLVAIEFGLDGPCGDPVSGEGRAGGSFQP